MRVSKALIPAAIVAIGVTFSLTQSEAKPDYTKKEKKACVYCHVTAQSKELNDAGKYYKEHNNSLEGYQKK